MLTTTLDGLWVLQVLTGTEVLAPEIGLRPHLPSVETSQTALAHPAAEELRQAGVIDDSGAVDEAVREWLTVLSRRDVALLLHVQTPSNDREPERILLARFAQWWVSIERCGFGVRLCGVGATSNEQSAARLINAEIERLIGDMPPAPMKPVTIEVDELLGTVDDHGGLRTFLSDRRFDGDQISLLTVAADPCRSAQASVIAIQSGVPGGPGHRHIGPGTVTIIDTPQGRLISEHVSRDGRNWMIVGPGPAGNIAAAVLAVLRALPAEEDWFSYRKVV